MRWTAALIASCAAVAAAAGSAGSDAARSELQRCHSGDGDACARLATMYAEGRGVEKRSAALAVILLQEGCKRGSTAACEALKHDSVALANRGCDEKDAAACELLGNLYLDQEPRDAAKSLAAFLRAVEIVELVPGLDQCSPMATSVEKRDKEIALAVARRCCEKGSKRGCAYVELNSGIPIARAPGPQGRTVAELFAEREGLAGKTIAVRGRVRDFTAGAGGGPNVVHLWDGTKAGEKDDLVVLTGDRPELGDLVTARGLVRLDYENMMPAPPVVLERARIEQKRR